EFAEAIDPEHGGVGRRERGFEGTKFPMPAAIGFLLQQAQDRKDQKLKKLVDLTLDRMARGGIYDQIGGGFHRYSTERTWTVPHFEKMLYDNAQLVELYARAFRADPNPLYRRVIEETLAFVEREMTSPQGAFYSALDADSEGEEGRFYVWTTDELNQATGALPGEEAKLFRLAFGGLDEPNFEEKYHILTRRLTDAEVAKETGMPPDAVREKLRAAREKLREVRSKRERPFLDTKVLTAWNGLMIGGYATAGEVLKQPAYIEKAKRAAEFVLKNLRTGDGRLLRTYATGPDGKGVARLNAYLDDYALLIHGLLNLHDATGEQRWLREARALADIMIKWHADEKRGGFYYTSHDHEKLFARTKDHFDGAQPSGNSMAALGLVRLWRKTGEERYREPAARSFKLFAGMLESEPQGMSALAAALDVYLDAAEKADGPEPPKKPLGADPGPRKSDAVVKVTAEAGKAAEGGKQPLTVTITIDKPWHIYANPVGSKILEGADTVVEVRSGGKKLPAEVEYPKGQKVEDPNVGDYFIYGGKVTVKAVVTRAEGDKGPLEVRVWLQACTDAGCLLPAEVKVPVK
ncbi:MAG TPA: protein-disulfide reductase DsbD domain-containing protein, partial [Gemmataceae bacterium]